MQTILIVINDAPYGSERAFNALRLAIKLNEQEEQSTQIKLFLMSDAVMCAMHKQNPVEGYDIQQMVEIALAQGSEVSLCKTCCSARGLSQELLIEGCEIGTLDDLAHWTLIADKVLTF
ncbi:DsrE/DsrF/TusD sulfur relay family protein [Photobacterium leiognathi]|uniref:DsrE/DsrF/TusD sulfur relay family protein n=1 Tax=Photobacterium leiognathi TaxID=553611 RepID=UPI00298269FC|nr:DsrE family protein [Photobacterium leiognathi]